MYKNKYFKYKAKYLKAKGVPMTTAIKGFEQPQIAFGTVQGTIQLVRRNIALAIKVGYRHIDTAIRYGYMVLDENTWAPNPRMYFQAVKDGITKGCVDANIPKSDIFVTIKSSLGKSVKELLEMFGIPFIGLLIGGGVDLEEALASGTVKHSGVENEGNYLKHNGFHQLQIQPLNHDKFYNDSYLQNASRHNMSLQFYSPISGIPEHLVYSINSELKNMIIKYYIYHYIKNTKNALIVGSQSGNSIEVNFNIFKSVMESEDKEDFETVKNFFSSKVKKNGLIFRG